MTETLTIWLRDACENTTVIINKSIGIPGDWITLSRVTVSLTPYLSNTTDVNITVPRDAEEGDYAEYLYLRADGQRIDIPVIIHVTKPDFELNVTIPPEKKEICQGDEIHATVDIVKNYPKQIYEVWRSKASDQFVLAVLYSIIYIKQDSNLERAIYFISKNIAPPLSLDFMKIL